MRERNPDRVCCNAEGDACAFDEGNNVDKLRKRKVGRGPHTGFVATNCGDHSVRRGVVFRIRGLRDACSSRVAFDAGNGVAMEHATRVRNGSICATVGNERC